MDTEEQVLQHDLKVAFDIQQGFLPKRLPEVPGAEVAAIMYPARQVGGDFYDVIPLTGERVGVLIADVSGKGIPAALYMALARTLLRTHSESARPRYLTDALESARVRRLMRSKSLGALAALGSVRRTNEYLTSHHPEPVMFLTLFYAVYDPPSRLLTYVNAGHNPPLLCNARTGQQDWLSPTDMAIGLLPERPFEAQERQLSPGDLLVMYTDGVTEAFNGEKEQFGTERLAAAMNNLSALSAGEVLSGILNSVALFVADAPQSDDLTLAVLKVNSP